MKFGKRYKIMAWILSLYLTVTLIPDFSFAVESDIEEKMETEDTTTYNLGANEKMTVFHGGEVRYENENGKLVDYDPSLVKIKDGEASLQKDSLDGYAYENNQGDNKHYLPNILSEETPIRMERENYSIEFSMTDRSLKQTEADQAAVTVEKETIPTIYEETKSLPVNAVYGTDDGTAIIKYTSGEYGLKETLILNEKPENNVFSYRLKLTGMTARENATDEGITLYDKKSGEIVGLYLRHGWMMPAGNPIAKRLRMS